MGLGSHEIPSRSSHAKCDFQSNLGRGEWAGWKECIHLCMEAEQSMNDLMELQAVDANEMCRLFACADYFTPTLEVVSQCSNAPCFLHAL